MKASALPMTPKPRVGRSRSSYLRRAMSPEVTSQVSSRSSQCPSSGATYSRKGARACRLKPSGPCTKGWQSRVPTKTIQIKSHKHTSQVSSVHPLKTIRIHNLRQLSTQLKTLSASHQWAFNSYQTVNSSGANQQLQIKLYPTVKVSQIPIKTHLREGKKGCLIREII